MTDECCRPFFNVPPKKMLFVCRESTTTTSADGIKRFNGGFAPSRHFEHDKNPLRCGSAFYHSSSTVGISFHTRSSTERTGRYSFVKCREEWSVWKSKRCQLNGEPRRGGETGMEENIRWIIIIIQGGRACARERSKINRWLQQLRAVLITSCFQQYKSHLTNTDYVPFDSFR